MECIATIHERISALIEKIARGNNSLFGSIIGANEGNIRGYRKNVMPKSDFLEKIVRNTDVNADWLLTGRGDMLKSDSLPASLDKIQLTSYKVIVSNLERKVKVQKAHIDELERANEELTRQLLENQKIS